VQPVDLRLSQLDTGLMIEQHAASSPSRVSLRREEMIEVETLDVKKLLLNNHDHERR
jgi:hypothetical protein